MLCLIYLNWVLLIIFYIYLITNYLFIECFFLKKNKYYFYSNVKNILNII